MSFEKFQQIKKDEKEIKENFEKQMKIMREEARKKRVEINEGSINLDVEANKAKATN